MMLIKVPTIAGAFRLRDVHYVAGEWQGRPGHDESQISIVLRVTQTENVRRLRDSA